MHTSCTLYVMSTHLYAHFPQHSFRCGSQQTLMHLESELVRCSRHQGGGLKAQREFVRTDTNSHLCLANFNVALALPSFLPILREATSHSHANNMRSLPSSMWMDITMHVFTGLVKHKSIWIQLFESSCFCQRTQQTQTGSLQWRAAECFLSLTNGCETDQTYCIPRVHVCVMWLFRLFSFLLLILTQFHFLHCFRIP